jgi:hypothetical protein
MASPFGLELGLRLGGTFGQHARGSLIQFSLKPIESKVTSRATFVIFKIMI